MTGPARSAPASGCRASIVSPWTVGGYVATEPFDHTSVLQLLEGITGVREPNITDWRRADLR